MDHTDTPHYQYPYTSDTMNDGQPGSSQASPLDLSFFQKLAEERKQTADGQPPKRRGPKPDSRPAQSRRQELNRQAQRTHRERKEQYVKLLETEIQSLRPKFEDACKELQTCRNENARLHELLAMNGISSFPNLQSPQSLDGSNSFLSDVQGFPAGSSSTSSPPPASQVAQMQLVDPAMQNMMGVHVPQQEQTLIPKIQYTQFAKDFVRSLELPCADHAQMLCTKSLDATGSPSGHVLMATCPTREHCLHNPDEQFSYNMPDLSDADLVKLFGLGQKLPNGVLEYGEISPIEAWRLLWSHRELETLSFEDLLDIQDILMSKVRCYGYGAVLEAFEVTDAIDEVASGRYRLRLTSDSN